MAAKVALILFGLFIGVVLGITGMSLIVVSPFFTEAKALGDISNLVVAVGAVFCCYALKIDQFSRVMRAEN